MSLDEKLEDDLMINRETAPSLSWKKVMGILVTLGFSCAGLAAADPLSDDFNPITIEPNPAWRFYDPYDTTGGKDRGQSVLTYSGTNALISIPAGLDHDLWVAGLNDAPRLLQPVTNSDFGIEVKFESVPSLKYQQQGIVAQENNDVFLRFDTYYDGVSTRLFAAYVNGAVSVVHRSIPLATTPPYQQVFRSGNQWTYRYSNDGISWVDAVTFTQPLNLTEIGFFAGASGSNPAYTGNVDYFVNLASPIADVDVWDPPAPQIRPWYGNLQTFGEQGVPQRWINILGNVVSHGSLATLTYSLNGGADQSLSNAFRSARLTWPGDFNIEIDRATLMEGINRVDIKATDVNGKLTADSVTINYVAGRAGPLPYTADWSTFTDIQGAQRVAQFVDGLWELAPPGLRTAEPGYNRTIAIGDESWMSNYEVSVPVTIHSASIDGGSILLTLGWSGHAGPISPRLGYPMEAATKLVFSSLFQESRLNLVTYCCGDTDNIVGGDVLQAGTTVITTPQVPYVLKARSEALGGGLSRVSAKFWPQGDPEPSQWGVTADVPTRKGAVALAASQSDVTFGNVTITPVPGADWNPTSNLPPADLAIALRAPRTVRAGKKVTYSVVVKNRQKNAVPLTLVTAELPRGVTLVKKPRYCSLSSSLLRCDLGRLAGRKRKVFSFTVRAMEKNVVNNSVNISSNAVSDLNTANNIAQATTVVR
jgi:hypothetical protein